MPSTGWNVFVASLVALVVYIAVQAELVLLGIVAGTLTFLGGWLLGYAINHDLLDSMEWSRIVVAGGVTAFTIVYTLLYSQQRYVLGLIVVCLVWFAAWFTSSMGPIKGNTGAMETIDEPQPPAGTEPGEPLHLGGPEERYNDDENGGFLGGLLSFGAADDTEYATEPNGAETAPERNRAGTADRSTQAEAADRTETAGTTNSSESIFGLGIFYEGEQEPSAGADDELVTRTESGPETGQVAATSREPDEEPVEVPVDQADQPGQRDQSAAAESTEPDTTSPAPEPGNHTAPAGTDPADQRRTSRGPVDSGGDGGETEADADAAEPEDDEPPEEHRVDVADDSDFVFG